MCMWRPSTRSILCWLSELCHEGSFRKILKAVGCIGNDSDAKVVCSRVCTTFSRRRSSSEPYSVCHRVQVVALEIPIGLRRQGDILTVRDKTMHVNKKLDQTMVVDQTVGEVQDGGSSSDLWATGASRAGWITWISKTIWSHREQQTLVEWQIRKNCQCVWLT